MEHINNFFGDMDLFLLDLLLKGRIEAGKILDIGFGTGRNLIHFLQRPEFEVHGIESDQSCVSLMQMMVASFENQHPDRFLPRSTTQLPYPEKFFETVICARVFHFLNDQEKWTAWEAISKVLVPGGVLYLTSNSLVNFETRSVATKDGKHTFPDETTGYFLSSTQLDRMVKDPKFEQIEPVRHIQYDNRHAETILVLQKK
ncbi:MAG: class I SAM-dependent methyltransferase [Cytophagales bacterium]|nr:class I SAM-dependent methyltransferase [Cytophagales bacterium]